VFLTQHHIQVLPPVLIALARPTVTIFLGMCLPVFRCSCTNCGDVAAVAHECCSSVPVRLRTLLRRWDRNRLVPKQLVFQFLFAPALRATANRCLPRLPARNSREPCSAPSRNRAICHCPTAPAPTPTAELLRFLHGHSPCRHSVLLIDGVSLPGNCPASLPPIAALAAPASRSSAHIR
jgi:hypothetical protein